MRVCVARTKPDQIVLLLPWRTDDAMWFLITPGAAPFFLLEYITNAAVGAVSRGIPG